MGRDVHWLLTILLTLPGVGGAIGFGLRWLGVSTLPPGAAEILSIAFVVSWVSLPLTAIAWIAYVTWLLRVAAGRRTTAWKGVVGLLACSVSTVGAWYSLAFWGIIWPRAL